MGEGLRKRRRRGPTAFNRKVSAYMRKHGVTLGEADHSLRGSGSGEGYRRKRRRPATYRRRRYGRGDGVYAGVLVGGKKRSTRGLSIRDQLELEKREDILKDEIADIQEELTACDPEAFKSYKFSSPAEKIRAMRECNLFPTQRSKIQRERALYNIGRERAPHNIGKKNVTEI